MSTFLYGLKGRLTVNLQTTTAIVQGLRQGKVSALARLITWAETGHAEFPGVMREVFPHTGGAHRLGITGPPGAGKSTLAERFIAHFRTKDLKVGVAAVDPSSPFTGGARLGDRVRRETAGGDDGGVVRRMATRGSLGGLALATEDALDLMDAGGFDQLLVETVGVGQVELDVARAADTVMVVLVPESGDGVQAMKAGLMEIGDIFVINKADREGAERLSKEMISMLSMRPASDWQPQVISVSAKENQGMPELFTCLEAHQKHLNAGALEARRLQTARERVLNTARLLLAEETDSPSNALTLEALAQSVASRTKSPYQAAEELVKGSI
jgi:LAO/AO transport system kinase